MTRGGESTRGCRGVSFALDAQGQVTDPAKASATQPYTCLWCHDRVHPVRAYRRRTGQTWRAHFSHAPHSTCAATGEGILHRAAKHLLRQRLLQHRAFGLHLLCLDCGREEVLDYQLRPGWQVNLEVPLGIFRGDVVIQDPEGRPAFAFEIRVTHEVGEEKARGLNCRWAEVDADVPALLKGEGGALELSAVNTNLFWFHPCTCGNNAPTNLLALERKAAREAEARRVQAERVERERRRYMEELNRQAARAEEERRARAKQREEEARHAEQERHKQQGSRDQFIKTFLRTQVPEVFDRLMVFSCVVADCPGCQKLQVFFDPGGVNMMPTWAPHLARRPSGIHPWQPVCPACDWSGPVPAGERRMYHGHAWRASATTPTPTSLRSALPHRAASRAEAQDFWWNREED